MGKSIQKSQLYKKLDKLYYQPEEAGSYGGVQKLFRAARQHGLKIPLNIIKEYLGKQASYSLHKPARKNFKRNPTVVGGIDQQWQADLADMQAISRKNKGAKYILTVIDVFSKYAWAIPIQNKGGEEMKKAFELLFKMAHPRKPQKLQTDAGKEFLNKDVQKVLKSQGVHHFVSHSDQKAAVVERFNRTLKTKIWTYFTAKQTNNYIENLQDFVKSYNNSFHRSIGMRPADVSPEDQHRIWNRLYGNNPRRSKKPSLVGEKTRISKVKGIFEKGYVPNWSEEHFHVKQNLAKKRPVYKLQDDQGEDIKGQFYEEELQPIEENRYLIEKILRKRKATKGEEFFVKWKGWPAKFNSWVKQEDFEKVGNPEEEEDA